MRPEALLPDVLHALGVFTRAEALAAGVGRDRLRRSDLEYFGHGLLAIRGVEHSHFTIAKAVCRALPNTWVSHGTGGVERGLLLPESVKPERPQVSRLRPANLPRTTAVEGHRAVVRPGEVVRVDGTPISSPARVWLELASVLTVSELIEFGDHLVRLPRQQFEGRATPHATVPDLRQLVEWHGRITGAGRARKALERIRVGADSVQETRLRLAMVDAGLPEPELQVVLDPTDRQSPCSDLGYRAGRIAIDYDGSTHLTPEQHARDIRRDRRYAVAGWRHITLNRHDAREGFRTAIEEIRLLLARAA